MGQCNFTNNYVFERRSCQYATADIPLSFCTLSMNVISFNQSDENLNRSLYENIIRLSELCYPDGGRIIPGVTIAENEYTR